jgi:hypothetical protein
MAFSSTNCYDDDDDNNNNNNNNNNTHQPMYWRMTISSCTGTAACLREKTIPFNQHDITFISKKIKNTILIDIAVPNTHNLAKTISDKQNKYQELANEVRMCYVEAKHSPSDSVSNIIYGSNPKVTTAKCKKLNLHPNTYIKMQKSVILGTCSIVRNFLNYKYDHPVNSC